MLLVNSLVRVLVAAFAAEVAALPTVLLPFFAEPDPDEPLFFPVMLWVTLLETLLATLAVTAATTAPKTLLPRLFFFLEAASFSCCLARFSYSLSLSCSWASSCAALAAASDSRRSCSKALSLSTGVS